jgi:hypothetical protein
MELTGNVAELHHPLGHALERWAFTGRGALEPRCGAVQQRARSEEILLYCTSPRRVALRSKRGVIGQNFPQSPFCFWPLS